MSIYQVLNQARSLRIEATSLINAVAAGAEKRAHDNVASPEVLDQLIREGHDPAQLQAYFKQFQARYQAAKARETALEDMAQRFGDVFAQLSAAVKTVEETTGEHTMVAGEIGLCISVMASLGESVRNAVLETSVAASLAGKQQSGLIIGAAATKPQIIVPEGFGIART